MVAGQRVPMLQLSYRAGPDSALAQTGADLGDAIGVAVSVRGEQPVTLRAPYDGEAGVTSSHQASSALSENTRTELHHPPSCSTSGRYGW